MMLSCNYLESRTILLKYPGKFSHFPFPVLASLSSYNTNHPWLSPMLIFSWCQFPLGSWEGTCLLSHLEVLVCWLDPGALEAAVILQEFFLSEKLAWSSPSAAVVQRLGSLQPACGWRWNFRARLRAVKCVFTSAFCLAQEPVQILVPTQR